MKHSAYFWSPRAFGSSGVGDDLIEMLENSEDNSGVSGNFWRRINWWRVAGSDAVGALGGFFMGGPKGSIIMGLASSALYVIGVV